MKKFMCYLLLSPFILCASGCNKSEKKNEPTTDPTPTVEPGSLGPVNVVLISGQSNAVGCTQSIYLADSMGPDKYDEYVNGYPEIQIAFDSWTKDWPATGITFYSQNSSKEKREPAFVKTKIGYGNSPQTFGPEVGIAEALHEKYANKLFLIKYACGGSNLKDDWAKKDSPMYQPFLNSA